MSRKLRTLMNPVAIEAPAAGVALTRKSSEFSNAALAVVSAGHGYDSTAVPD